MAYVRKSFIIVSLVSLGVILYQPILQAQGPAASISGLVTDQSKAVISGVMVEAVEVDRQTYTRTITNGDGFYRLSDLAPGHYRLVVSKDGFRTIVQAEVHIQVQDQLAQNFELVVGSVDQSITVEGLPSIVQTQDASVGVVVDKTFISDLPLNGRSFQSLIALAPGYVQTTPVSNNLGQFVFNGQRVNANYMTVDGVSVNLAITPYSTGAGNGDAASTSALGTTTNLTSVDALEEFKVLTSSFSPEFGRSPGAQIVAVTRSGTNLFHGSLYEYFRNDMLDANDWFANANRIAHPPLRHNDFGGTIGGPLWKNKTFFFFSQEDVRLTQPTTITGSVPSLSVRQAAGPAVAPFINVFPLPTGPDTANGYAAYAAAASPPSSLDATSIRFDHEITSSIRGFYRFNRSPANQDVAYEVQTAQTATLTSSNTAGLDWIASPAFNGGIKLNWSSQTASSQTSVSNSTAVLQLFPVGSSVGIGGLASSGPSLGLMDRNRQSQFNAVPSISWLLGRHQMKIGFDYRRLSPNFDPNQTTYSLTFSNPSQALMQTVSSFRTVAQLPTSVLLQNYSAFIQDTWSIKPNLHLTYGLRWEDNPTPENRARQGMLIVGVSGNPPTPTILPPNSPLWHSTAVNFAPRIGIAWQINSTPGKELLLRVGGGLFFDMGWDLSTYAVNNNPAFSANVSSASVPLPLTQAILTPPSLGVRAVYTGGVVVSFPNDVRLPRVWQSNVSIEQALGRSQSITLSYVGAFGRDLITQVVIPIASPLPAIEFEQQNGASNYNSLQTIFRRRLLKGLQMLGSYSWAHSIDNSTGGTVYVRTNPINALSFDRGPSDFDIRHSLSIGSSYQIPAPVRSGIFGKVLSGWGVDGIVQAHSALPVNITNLAITASGTYTIRPDLIYGVPLWIDNSNLPGGRKINSAAFATPAVVEDGNLGRNALRGFGFVQADIAIKRSFQLLESARLTLRGEAFNVLNTPNFGPPLGSLFSSSTFGISPAMLANSSGALGLNSLYHVGGPRSLQLALRLDF